MGMDISALKKILHFNGNDISHNDELRYEFIILPEGSGNIISSHKRLLYCHSHYFNYQIQ